MMRFIQLFALAAVLAAGQARSAEPAAPETSTPPALGDRTLDDLFEQLGDHAAAPDGKRIETEILKRFEHSGSDTADLLMSWANQAMAEKSYPLALDILDQVIVLQPNYPEAWNKRATVAYLSDDYPSALADIRQTLLLEPRHFGALAGLGLILEETGKKEQAIVVFRKALAIDPLLDKVKESLDRLEKDAARNAI